MSKPTRFDKAASPSDINYSGGNGDSDLIKRKAECDEFCEALKKRKAASLFPPIDEHRSCEERSYEEFADLHLICKDGIVKVERSYLIHSSDFFRNMFRANMKESVPIVEGAKIHWEVKLPEDSAEVVTMVYKALLAGGKGNFKFLDVDHPFFFPIVRFMHKYQIDGLDHLIENMGKYGVLETCFEIDKELSLCKRKILIDYCIKFLRTSMLYHNYKDVSIYRELFDKLFVEIPVTTRSPVDEARYNLVESFCNSGHERADVIGRIAIMDTFLTLRMISTVKNVDHQLRLATRYAHLYLQENNTRYPAALKRSQEPYKKKEIK
jgi:hypothetical protein